MPTIMLPNGEQSGECRINGDPCDYKIDGETFSYRPESGGEWSRRRIQGRYPGSELTHYVCANNK